MGGGPQWPSKPSTSTPVRATGGTKGQPLDKPTKGVPSTGKGKVMKIKEKINPHPGHLLGMMEEEVEMVMVVVVEMITMMVMMIILMTQNQLLRVRELSNRLHLVVGVPAGAGGGGSGGDEPPPGPGVGNMGPRGR